MSSSLTKGDGYTQNGHKSSANTAAYRIRNSGTPVPKFVKPASYYCAGPICLVSEPVYRKQTAAISEETIARKNRLILEHADKPVKKNQGTGAPHDPARVVAPLPVLAEPATIDMSAFGGPSDLPQCLTTASDEYDIFSAPAGTGSFFYSHSAAPENDGDEVEVIEVIPIEERPWIRHGKIILAHMFLKNATESPWTDDEEDAHSVVMTACIDDESNDSVYFCAQTPVVAPMTPHIPHVAMVKLAEALLPFEEMPHDMSIRLDENDAIVEESFCYSEGTTPLFLEVAKLVASVSLYRDTAFLRRLPIILENHYEPEEGEPEESVTPLTTPEYFSEVISLAPISSLHAIATVYKHGKYAYVFDTLKDPKKLDIIHRTLQDSHILAHVMAGELVLAKNRAFRLIFPETCVDSAVNEYLASHPNTDPVAVEVLRLVSNILTHSDTEMEANGAFMSMLTSVGAASLANFTAIAEQVKSLVGDLFELGKFCLLTLALIIGTTLCILMYHAKLIIGGTALGLVIAALVSFYIYNKHGVGTWGAGLADKLINLVLKTVSFFSDAADTVADWVDETARPAYHKARAFGTHYVARAIGVQSPVYYEGTLEEDPADHPRFEEMQRTAMLSSLVDAKIAATAPPTLSPLELQKLRMMNANGILTSDEKAILAANNQPAVPTATYVGSPCAVPAATGLRVPAVAPCAAPIQLFEEERRPGTIIMDHNSFSPYDIVELLGEIVELDILKFFKNLSSFAMAIRGARELAAFVLSIVPATVGAMFAHYAPALTDQILYLGTGWAKHVEAMEAAKRKIESSGHTEESYRDAYRIGKTAKNRADKIFLPWGPKAAALADDFCRQINAEALVHKYTVGGCRPTLFWFAGAPRTGKTEAALALARMLAASHEGRIADDAVYIRPQGTYCEGLKQTHRVVVLKEALGADEETNIANIRDLMSIPDGNWQPERAFGEKGESYEIYSMVAASNHHHCPAVTGFNNQIALNSRRTLVIHAAWNTDYPGINVGATTSELLAVAAAAPEADRQSRAMFTYRFINPVFVTQTSRSFYLPPAVKTLMEGRESAFIRGNDVAPVTAETSYTWPQVAKICILLAKKGLTAASGLGAADDLMEFAVKSRYPAGNAIPVIEPDNKELKYFAAFMAVCGGAALAAVGWKVYEYFTREAQMEENYGSRPRALNTRKKPSIQIANMGIEPFFDRVAAQQVAVRSPIGSMFGFMLDESTLLTNHHFFLAIGEDSPFTIALDVQSGDEIVFKERFTAKNLCVVPNSDGTLSDVAMYRLDYRIPGIRDLRGYFPDRVVFDRETEIVRIYPGGVENSRVSKRIATGSFSSPRFAVIKQRNVYSYQTVADKGDCGTIIAAKQNGSWKIVGFHIARTSATFAPGVFVPIDRTAVNMSHPKYGTCTDPREMPVISTANISSQTVTGNFIHLGKVSKPAVPPLETKLKATPFKDKESLFPCRVGVSQKDTPRVLATESKYGVPRDRISHRQIEYGVRVAKRLLCVETKRPRAYMPLEEILDVDLSTATGYNWPGKRRKDLILVDANGNRSMSQELSQAYRGLEDDYVKGRFPPALFIPCPKDEILTLENIAKGKVRTFQYDNLEHYLLGRKYIGNFCEHITDIHLQGPIRIGLNIHSRDFHDVMEQTFEYITKDEVIDIDYSGYDRSLNAYLAAAAAQVIDAFYGFEDPGRTQWLLSNFFAVEIYRNAIWQRLQGLPSGMFGTSVINSVINIILIAAAFKNLIPQATVEDFNNNVKMSIYGDDNLLGPSQSAKDSGFNFVYLQNFFATVGIVITPADKDNASALFVKRTSTQFLKKRILWSEEFQGYVPVIPAHYVWDHLSYARDISVAGLVQLCNSLLGEYFFRGRIRASKEMPVEELTFDELRRKMAAVCGQEGLVTFEHLNESYWDQSALPEVEPEPWVEQEDEWEVVMEDNMGDTESVIKNLEDIATILKMLHPTSFTQKRRLVEPATDGLPEKRAKLNLKMSANLTTGHAHYAQNEQTEEDVVMEANMGNTQVTNNTNIGTGHIDSKSDAKTEVSPQVSAAVATGGGNADADLNLNQLPKTGNTPQLPAPAQQKIKDGFKAAAHTAAKPAAKKAGEKKRSASLTRDRPTNWQAPITTVNGALYLPSLNGTQHGVWLSDMVGVDTCATADDMMCSDDCSTLEYYTRRWGLLTKLPIPYSTLQGALIAQMSMTPFQDLENPTFGASLLLSPLEFAASLYKFWRGGLEIKFNIFGPAAVSGRLAICLGYNDFGPDPGYQTAVTGPSVMWDFDSMNREKVIRIDYINPNKWLQAPYNIDTVNAPQNITTRPMNCSLGTLRLYNVTTLTTPNATFTQPLLILMTYRASPTFEVHNYAPLFLSNAPCSNPTSVLAKRVRARNPVLMEANMSSGETVHDAEPQHSAVSQGVAHKLAPAIPIELKKFAFKYANLHTFTITTATAPGPVITYQHPVDLIVAQAKYAQAAMKFYRGDLHIKAFPRGNGWQGGAVYLTFVPYYDGAGALFDAQILSLPGVFLDLSSAEPVELIVPFSYFQDYFYEGCPTAGRVVFWLLDHLQVPTLGGNSVDFEVQVAWSNFESFVPNEIGDSVIMTANMSEGSSTAEQTTAQTELALQKPGPPPEEPILSRHQIVRVDTPQNLQEALKRSVLLDSGIMTLAPNIAQGLDIDLPADIGRNENLYSFMSQMFQVEKGDMVLEITLRGARSTAGVDVSNQVSAFLNVSNSYYVPEPLSYAAQFRVDADTQPAFTTPGAGSVGYNPPGTAMLLPGHTRAIIPFFSQTHVNATVFSDLVGPGISVGQTAHITFFSKVAATVDFEIRFAVGDSHRFGAFKGIPRLYLGSVKKGLAIYPPPDANPTNL